MEEFRNQPQPTDVWASGDAYEPYVGALEPAGRPKNDHRSEHRYSAALCPGHLFQGATRANPGLRSTHTHRFRSSRSNASLPQSHERRQERRVSRQGAHVTRRRQHHHVVLRQRSQHRCQYPDSAAPNALWSDTESPQYQTSSS